MLHFIWILYVFCTSNASEYHHSPRIILTEKDIPFRRHSLNGTHTRTELILGPDDGGIYVGGHRTLSYIDFQMPNQSKEVTLFEKECRDKQTTGSCDYDITILHKIKNGTEMFVCGTNGILPVCCQMAQLGSCSSSSAEGMAPFSVKEKAPSLYIEDELYTTANLYAQGDGVGIRRHFGKRGKISSRANKTEQRFVAMAASGPRTDRLQDRIYMFMEEKNLDKHPDSDHWVSRVIQVCKADRGGTKNILERLWTSLMSARLYCGIHFSRLLDVDVLHATNWRDSKVYALFTNPWGMRAVCVYTMGTIDKVFKNSKFKNSAGSAQDVRRRECVKNSQTLPREVLKQMKDYQEMEDWIRPMSGSSPFMVSHRHYRHIRAASVIPHIVLFLSLDSGKVQAVLAETDPPFVIAELQPFRNRTHIQNVLLQPATNKMYVSTSSEVVELDLLRCTKYGQRCEDCVQARDPYCGWDGTRCTAASNATVQDVMHGNYKVCEEAGKTDEYVAPRTVYSLPLLAEYFLLCPLKSGHAEYSWIHRGRRLECLLAEGHCLLLIENMTAEQEGNYSCMSTEGGYEKTLIQYELRLITDHNQNKPQTTTVSPTSEVPEADRCTKYGQRCKDCVQARDPYCDWNGTQCTAASNNPVQDVEHGNYKVCEEAGKTPRMECSLSLLAKHFLLCPLKSGHAEYSWIHRGRRLECLPGEGHCLLLIENMSAEQEGNYSCMSTEGGHKRTLIQYELRLESRARGLASCALPLIFLLVSLILLN
ncbi:semaphorin-7A-like [Conger conger]|uniref:semaphorin-7A-like n=1 Tax=Conger conger TaxID=82655 RepID=UPI002A59D25B|nr:semaphorin-7A-like [Conger conger]